jgi:hypothetical protein
MRKGIHMKKIAKKKTSKKASKKAKKQPRRVAKKTKPKAAKKLKPEKPIGTVTHYFGNIKVAIVKFKVPVSSGAQVYFRGATTDFKQAIASMQFDHAPIARAPKGKQVGIKVSKKVRPGDKVFKAK